MKKKEIIDALLTDVSGGNRSSSDVLTSKYVAKNLDAVRAIAIEKRYMRDKGAINPSCYQKYYLQYDPNLQVPANPQVPNDYIAFQLPPVIQIGKENGIRYLGAAECFNNWRQIRSREEMSSVMHNSYTKICNHPDNMYYLYDGNRDIVQVYNNKNVREGLAECIFQTPSEMPFFNELLDDYPVDIALVEIMRNVLYERFAITKSKEPSSIPYEQPDTTPSAPPKNVKLGPPSSNE